ncbi:GMC family oxidoreductase N-terminal domain-containing protein [Streptomyces sp. NA04227]|uniref:GMC oxidoreductase n=1 Tax=Streptomyces sp. NA04227 TaxID=2742136 RepID=UPI0015919C6D|nr:GMC oxidoreductase [Streptomyces sp. NA04227]QKW07971.1 GMC family oxidoreductase N-terminal domain-containing protein [Streptomyces sp. NA04227]
MTTYTPDVLLVGSGPVGAALAHRLVVEGGLDVLMVELGAQESHPRGENRRNRADFRERDVVPPAVRAVGGLGTVWECGVPTFVPEVELTWQGQKYPIDAAALDKQYAKAGEQLGRTTGLFPTSVRHRAVRKALLEAGHDAVTELPLAARTVAEPDHERVVWAGTDALFGPLGDPAFTPDAGSFTLLSDHLCTGLSVERDGENRRVVGAVVTDLDAGAGVGGGGEVSVVAKAYVVAGGTMATPQLLAASGLGERLPALGRYATDSPIAVCRVVLKSAVVDAVEGSATGAALERIRQHRKRHPEDRLPIPHKDTPVNLFLPPSQDRPWHAHIRSVPEGVAGTSVDERIVLELRWFGICRPREDNRVEFSTTAQDRNGMPQPALQLTAGADDAANAEAMLRHMVEVAQTIGQFLPGAEPQLIPAGAGMQLAGTTRMGTDPDTSVVNADSRVWGVANLYLGGNGLHPFGNASAPTLTSIAAALHAADAITETVKKA